MDEERWLPVVGYEGLYEISDHGRIRSVRTGLLRKSHAKPSGHTKTDLWKDGKVRVRYVHVLVLEAFVAPRPPGLQGCHFDGDATNNHVSNLRWDTALANAADMRRHGTHNHSKKTHCIWGHELVHPNLTPRPGARACRACALGRNHIWRHGGDVQETTDRYYARIMTPGYKPKQIGVRRNEREK